MSGFLSGACWRATVFGESGCAGNSARVWVLEDAPAPAVMAALAQAHKAPASCFLWPAARGFGLQCYSPGGPIQCCGHGMLASAAALWEGSRAAAFVRLVPALSEDPVEVWFADGIHWLRLPRLPCRSVKVPAWTTGAFSRAPVEAAVAAGDEGYLVLEFGPAWPLQELQVDVEAISVNTGRAVIATQGTARGHHDFSLRYFAPQYGVAEDAVTGSAGRILADYWNQRRGGDAYSAWQCSAAGGVIHLRTAATTIEVGGTVTVVREG